LTLIEDNPKEYCELCRVKVCGGTLTAPGRGRRQGVRPRRVVVSIPVARELQHSSTITDQLGGRYANPETSPIPRFIVE